jgi:hypothetical protein
VIPTGYRARASLATNVRGEFAQLGYFNAEEAGATVFSAREERRKGETTRSYISSSQTRVGKTPTTVVPS